MKPTPTLENTSLQSVEMRAPAYVPVDNPVQAVLRAALERLGPNGERWLQGGCELGDRVCSVTALGRAVTGDVQRTTYSEGMRCPAAKYLDAASREVGYAGAETLNDHAKSFNEVRTMFLRAIHLSSTSR